MPTPAHRQPQGVPIGGQFAPGAHDEGDVTLDDDRALDISYLPEAQQPYARLGLDFAQTWSLHSAGVQPETYTEWSDHGVSSPDEVAALEGAGFTTDQYDKYMAAGIADPNQMVALKAAGRGPTMIDELRKLGVTDFDGFNTRGATAADIGAVRRFGKDNERAMRLLDARWDAATVEGAKRHGIAADQVEGAENALREPLRDTWRQRGSLDGFVDYARQLDDSGQTARFFSDGIEPTQARAMIEAKVDPYSYRVFQQVGVDDLATMSQLKADGITPETYSQLRTWGASSPADARRIKRERALDENLIGSAARYGLDLDGIDQMRSAIAESPWALTYLNSRNESNPTPAQARRWAALRLTPSSVYKLRQLGATPPQVEEFADRFEPSEGAEVARQLTEYGWLPGQ